MRSSLSLTFLMASFISWNIRGIANSPSIRRLKKLIALHRVLCFAILEPRVSKDKILDYQRKLNCHGAISNEASTIWFFWKEGINCNIISNKNQHITINITMAGGMSIYLTCVYASCDGGIRRELWQDLTNTNTDLPWIISGDFNVVSTQEEKIGGSPINHNDVGEFNSMIDNIGLLDGGYTGRKFTWCNNRMGSSRILERLDRVLYNSAWNSSFNTKVAHLSRTCSDHAPLNVKISLPMSTGSAFRFLNVWSTHPLCMAVIQEEWSKNVQGRPLVKFAAKLKAL